MSDLPVEVPMSDSAEDLSTADGTVPTSTDQTSEAEQDATATPSAAADDQSELELVLPPGARAVPAVTDDDQAAEGQAAQEDPAMDVDGATDATSQAPQQGQDQDGAPGGDDAAVAPAPGAAAAAGAHAGLPPNPMDAAMLAAAMTTQDPQLAQLYAAHMAQAAAAGAPMPEAAMQAFQAHIQATMAAHAAAAQQQAAVAAAEKAAQEAAEAGKPAPGTEEWIKQRRESHKEVERRRREVINTGINELAKIVPNCSDRNKGGILHRAVQYIQQLKEAEQRNAERWTLDKMLADQAINDLTGYVEYLKSENEALRAQISQLGGEAPPRAQPPAPSVPPYHAHAMAAAMHPGYHYFAAAAAASGAPSGAPTAAHHWPAQLQAHQVAAVQAQQMMAAAAAAGMTPEMAAAAAAQAQAHAQMAAVAEAAASQHQQHAHAQQQQQQQHEDEQAAQAAAAAAAAVAMQHQQLVAGQKRGIEELTDEQAAAEEEGGQQAKRMRVEDGDDAASGVHDPADEHQQPSAANSVSELGSVAQQEVQV